uniref:Uncharacterized protein n=1 Tax=Aplanochytrium stocchinoi TaxID=215587 RepID=A0A6S8FAZ7_9STRA|mmetsp:Transcript_403/g.468  ORF Transcript_403/g.468 Transcript_403/m.468 type:complete len:176 (+) Transcript_403:51-578(+)|eukprot:CAMPEP_0204822526 /NCGR_PEP_ID=MMETSP1346-20131115/719_1 /ASSEMBLY_ACC=CAM_ASM_000771 /TAXON_ID=215587 /ORGANISM="Aplanochytrium stocchinoi, Strain GSBS06" /LENGTH=175 /DNA_ID=CAMNT_0051948781 /DNA_START=91 /DNA_END=618 /DNA_ORIENTATION=+
MTERNENSTGTQDLIEAAANGNLKKVQDLINQGVSVNRFVGFLESLHVYDWTPLHAAAAFGQVRILTELLKSGAEVDACRVELLTPLILAADEGHTEIVKLLIENGAEINHIDRYKRNAVHRAAASGHIEIVKMLVEAGINVSLVDETGCTPLDMAAAKHNDTPEMKTLLTPPRR